MVKRFTALYSKMLKLLFGICILLPTLSEIDTIDLCLTEFVKTNTAGTTLCGNCY